MAIGMALWLRKGACAIALAVVACLFAVNPASAQSRSESTRPESPRSGSQRTQMPHPDSDERPVPSQTRPLPEIVARVQSTPPYNTMDYIGVAGFQVRQMIYVLRFIDGRQVVVVHVDARSGRIVSRAP